MIGGKVPRTHTRTDIHNTYALTRDILHVITLHNRLRKNPNAHTAMRTVMIGGKVPHTHTQTDIHNTYAPTRYIR